MYTPGLSEFKWVKIIKVCFRDEKGVMEPKYKGI